MICFWLIVRHKIRAKGKCLWWCNVTSGARNLYVATKMVGGIKSAAAMQVRSLFTGLRDKELSVVRNRTTPEQFSCFGQKLRTEVGKDGINDKWNFQKRKTGVYPYLF
jgi:hypothetical protein